MDSKRQIYNQLYGRQDVAKAAKQREARGRSVRRLLKYLPQKEYDRALDLGCGSGTSTYWLSDYARQILAVDISEAGIALAREANGHERIDYQVADVKEMRSPEKFDCITTFGLSLMNLPDVRQLFDYMMGLIERFGAPRVSYLYYSTTNFTGSREGWVYYSDRDLRELIALLEREKRIRWFDVRFVLPWAGEASYRNALHRLLLRALAAAYRVRHGPRHRFKYVVVMDVQQPAE